MNNKYHFFPGNILLPKDNLEKWAVIACDQYTSEPEYWKSVEQYVEDTPSSLNLILPEVYLSSDNSERIEKINKKMAEYIKNDVFYELENTFIYTERSVSGGKIRRGIIGLIDLEEYDYAKDSSAIIRATEQTVIERIPPRVQVRKDAYLELPHVMLLIDDAEKTVIEPFSDKKGNLNRLYDFDLMKNSGHISGYAINGLDSELLKDAVNALIENSADKLLFAVGDGNHSLATAKECYNFNKNEKTRYALVEIVNIHDTSLEFEPIYRVIFGINAEALISDFVSSLGGEYNGKDAQKFICVYRDSERVVSVKPSSKLCVGTLQKFLDEYLKDNPAATIDYIHGEDVVKNLCKNSDTVGFIFDGMRKDELFEAIKQDGSLPRKTFSMGQASDKRFYLESRKIK